MVAVKSESAQEQDWPGLFVFLFLVFQELSDGGLYGGCQGIICPASAVAVPALEGAVVGIDDDRVFYPLGLGIPCPIATFHSTGNAVIHVNAPEEKLNIVDNSRLYFVIRDYFRGSVMQNESIVNKLIMFFASYFDAPYEGDDFNAFFNNIAMECGYGAWYPQGAKQGVNGFP